MAVHPADVRDRDGARPVLARARAESPSLRLVWADGGYAGALVGWVRDTCGLALRVVPKAAGAGFVVQPRRWVVGRTFAWLGKYRRPSKDYELRTDVSEAMVAVATIHVVARRSLP